MPEIFLLLEQINFQNPSNLLFLAIVFLLTATASGIFFFIVEKIIGALRAAFRFGTKKNNGGKEIKAAPESAAVNPSQAPEYVRRQIIPEGNFIPGPLAAQPKSDQGPIREDGNIAAGLSKLKAVNPINAANQENNLAAKMPSRTEHKEDGAHGAITIPRPKKFNIPEAGERHPLPDGIAAGAVDTAHANQQSASVNEENFFQKPAFAENNLVPSSRERAASGVVKIQKTAANNNDQSIFKGEPEVSRIKLEHEMKYDPHVWQSEKQVGLALSPVERAKLVHEVFSPVLGRNISKTDLKWSLKKLNQKMLDAKDPVEHTKIRKEIKFFKKIGGIK